MYASKRFSFRFCVNVDVSSGGSFKYSDFDGTYQGLKSFTPVVNKKVLCFKYDNVPPVHCSESNNCETNPLQLSSRVTKSGKVTVTVTGWTDPIPDNGTKAQASGIDYFKINVYGVKHLDPKTLEIDYNTPVSSSKNLEGDFSIRIDLRDQPQMYVTYLETHDVAVNVRFSRRFLLYDNESKLVTMDNKSFCTVSASEDTKCRWQIHHGNISLDWKDRFYNDFYIQNNYFVPIKADTGNSVVGVYEQLTGVLPVSGTKSVNGVTGFSYQCSRNNGTKTRWMNVPDFTKQEMSLNLPVKDGETYEVWIKAQDIMVNTVVESVIVHIDRSMADIAYTWFVREGTNQIYVHNDTDLSKMVFQFRAFDVHSGITSVQWSLGTANAASDIGTGALRVIKLDGEFICQSNINCYCPDVGPCEYQNYTLTLDSLVASNTNRGYNGEYDITPCVTNGAILKSFDHLVFLVNDSRPVVDTIEAGTTGSGLYIRTGLGVVLLVGLVTAVLVILKRKKKICYSKHQKDVVRYNAAPGNTTYDSITRGGDQAQQYETLGSLTLPPAPGNKTYETLTRENDQTQPYMSLRFVVKADAPKNPAYETLTRENDQAQLYMNMGCLGQAAKPNKST